MHVYNKISYCSILFLFSVFVIVSSSNVIISYEKTNSDTIDKSALMRTTDCINNLITGVFMGSSSGNCGNINNNSDTINSTNNEFNSSKNALLNFKSETGQASDFLAMNHGLTNVGPAPSLDDPSVYTKSAQIGGIPIDNISNSHPLVDDKSKDSSTSSIKNDELGNLLNKKNKHGNEIFACFNRAIVSTSSLSDSAIIKCAKDYDSFK